MAECGQWIASVPAREDMLQSRKVFNFQDMADIANDVEEGSKMEINANHSRMKN